MTSASQPHSNPPTTPGDAASSAAAKFVETDYLAANPDVAAAVAAGDFPSGSRHYALFGRAEGRPLRPIAAPPSAAGADAAGADAAGAAAPDARHQRFEHRAPSVQAAIDIFRGNWASDLSGVLGVEGTGVSGLFDRDDRPALAAGTLGANGRLDGLSVLELGPLEGGHTRALEQLGASEVTAVESNVEAYLKCLVIKEVCGLERSRFLLGDVVAYLRGEPRRFDLVFCSGILYHMADPLALIEQVARTTDRCFVWTHVFRPDHQRVPYRCVRHAVGGYEASYWSHDYGDKTAGFWGGNRSSASWLEREELLGAFRHFGLDEIVVHRDDTTSPNGPNITFSARRRDAR